jgi:4-hydroxy-tetrahydrodipicolinate synthase
MSIPVKNLKGIYPAIITPMLPGGEIDFLKLDQLIEDLIEAGVAGICACGSTGESPVLTQDEHLQLVVHIASRIDQRCQIIVSAGSNCTRSAVNLSNAVENALGPTTFLHVTGYYNNPPQTGLNAHFLTVADSFSMPESNLIIYNVPSRTGSNVEVETIATLARHPQIIGVKESSGNLSQVKSIIEQTDEESFHVLTGECDQISETIAMGGFGAISATANLAPRLLVRIASSALSAEAALARTLQDEALPAVKAVFSAKNPIPLAMLFNSHLRLPMITIPELLPQLKNWGSGRRPEG